MRLSKSLWAEIANKVVYLCNRSSIQRMNTTEYKSLKGEKSYLGHIKVLGCRVWIYIHKEKLKKLDEKSYQGIHLKY